MEVLNVRFVIFCRTMWPSKESIKHTVTHQLRVLPQFISLEQNTKTRVCYELLCYTCSTSFIMIKVQPLLCMLNIKYLSTSVILSCTTITYGCCKPLLYTLWLIFVPLFQNSTLGAHSFDFSGVRDDKCHKSIDNGQVQSSFYDYAVHLNIARGTTKAWVDTITGYLIGCKFGQDVAPLSLVGILLAQFVLC